ncbi:hypothetical protein N9X77_04045 [Luminiphilus sp.]|jgi:hypothetical protein|nr:hypothetical protein [bacterium]MDA9950792.1 hypothetical protein [Luminiphilus sp.]MDB2557121.1 hypothetical protein [Luminiphilus sp.]MDB2653318.1 hypothetical protein [Luminiphilus sp.]MDC3393857.1 hypothetical protein [Luminiphilus sp.]
MKLLSSLLLTLAIALISPLASSQSLDRGASFEGNFAIDAMHTMDGSNYQVAASGEAGEYGRVYLSYTFTNKLSLNEMGEFTGYAWTQSGEEVVTASLQGVWKKNGAVFDMYTFDAVSNGLINVATGEMDLVNRTMTFNVAPLK